MNLKEIDVLSYPEFVALLELYNDPEEFLKDTPQTKEDLQIRLEEVKKRNQELVEKASQKG